MVEYVPNEYSKIDSYLNRFNVVKGEKQTSIFDFI